MMGDSFNKYFCTTGETPQSNINSHDNNAFTAYLPPPVKDSMRMFCTPITGDHILCTLTQTWDFWNSQANLATCNSLNLGCPDKNHSRIKSTVVAINSYTTNEFHHRLNCLPRANVHTLSSHTMNPTAYFHSSIPMLFTISYLYMCCCRQ